MMKWGQNTTCKFVEQYINQECLWNYKLPDFINRQARVDAFKEIARFMNIENFGVFEVNRKIQILRSTFSQELKKFENNPHFSSNLQWFNMFESALKSANITLHVPDGYEEGLIKATKVLAEKRENDSTTPVGQYYFRFKRRSKENVKKTKFNSKKAKSFTRNCHQAFGKYVAGELDKFDKELIPHIKKAISDIIYSASIGHLYTQSNIKDWDSSSDDTIL